MILTKIETIWLKQQCMFYQNPVAYETFLPKSKYLQQFTHNCVLIFGTVYIYRYYKETKWPENQLDN